jgi:uridine phosphorylase
MTTNNSSISVAAHHIRADSAHFFGNSGQSRFVLLPGSDGRAKQIADRLVDVVTVTNERQLNCFFGTLDRAGSKIDLAVVSTGMGCASMDIVIGELLSLGMTRFLRLGTAGSMQPGFVKYGDLAIASASVRDEATTARYAPIEFPALADPGLVAALEHAATNAGVGFHTGTVHCKDNLHAREFGIGPMRAENERYMEIIRDCGAIASEMETAALFIRCQIAHQQHRLAGTWQHRPRAGALLAIIGDAEPFAHRDNTPVTNQLIETGLDAVAHFYKGESQAKP